MISTQRKATSAQLPATFIGFSQLPKQAPSSVSCKRQLQVAFGSGFTVRRFSLWPFFQNAVKAAVFAVWPLRKRGDNFIHGIAEAARPGEKSMQFGRFHGIALLALGALLLLLQTVLIFNEKSPPARTTSSSQQSQQPAAAEPSGRSSPALDYLAGVLGIVLAGAGAYVLAQASHKGAQKRLEEDRREEDRSFGRQGHHVSTPTIWKER